MSYSAKPPRRIIAVLKLPEYQVPLLITRAQMIVERMTDNPWFPSPVPTLAAVQAAIADLSRAEVGSVMRSKASVTVRNEKRAALVSLLDYLRAFVQGIADANYEFAAEIIESAGMYVKNVRGRGGRTFQAKPGRVSGEVVLEVPKSGDRTGYEFQYSLDGGLTWLGLPQQFTNKTTVTVSGLKPGPTVHFRYRATVKGLTGDWSDPIAIIVD